MTEYRRKITGGEKAMVALNELRPPFVIQLTLEGTGDPAPEALYEALERTTAANPGSALKLDEAGEFWVPGPPPTLTLVDAPDFTAAHGDDAGFLKWPLDARTGPTCELLKVNGKDHTYLVFRALHAVMDGQGTLLWAKDFMRCLRGEDPVGHPSTLDVQALCDAFKDDRRPAPTADAMHPMGMPNETATSGHRWRRVRLPGPLQAGVAGKIAGTLAELARQSHGETGLVRIHLPTDLRVHARKERSTANLFGSLFIEVEPGVTADEIGMKIVRMLYEREGKRPVGLYVGYEAGSLAAYRVKAYYDLHNLHDTGRYAFSATLSHLGKLDSASLSGPGWTATSALFVPLVGDVCVVSVNGFDDHTEVAVGLGARFADDARLDALASALERGLTA